MSVVTMLESARPWASLGGLGFLRMWSSTRVRMPFKAANMRFFAVSFVPVVLVSLVESGIALVIVKSFFFLLVVESLLVLVVVKSLVGLVIIKTLVVIETHFCYTLL